MSPLTAAQAAQVGTQHQKNPFVWLYAFDVPSTPPSVFRVAAFDKSIQFGTNSEGTPLSWAPFPIEHQGIPEDSEGTQSTLRVSVSNITREAQALIEFYDGLIDQDVRIYLVNTATLLEPIPYLDVRGRVLASSATEDAAVFDVGLGNLLRAYVPRNRILRRFCGHVYKGPECGYVGALPSCDKSLDGSNGCIAHDNKARFGGFPGVG